MNYINNRTHLKENSLPLSSKLALFCITNEYKYYNSLVSFETVNKANLKIIETCLKMMKKMYHVW